MFDSLVRKVLDSHCERSSLSDIDNDHHDETPGTMTPMSAISHVTKL